MDAHPNQDGIVTCTMHLRLPDWTRDLSDDDVDDVIVAAHGAALNSFYDKVDEIGKVIEQKRKDKLDGQTDIYDLVD